MAKVDWAELIFSSAHNILEKLESIAHKRFPNDRQLADHAFNHALDKLRTKNWCAMQAYQGHSSPTGYLIITFQHALEDFARERFGRPRPPQEIKRQGALWLELYQRIILEKQPEQNVIDIINTRTALTAEETRAIIRRIKQLCPTAPQPHPISDENALDHIPDHPNREPHRAAFTRPLQERIESFLSKLLRQDRSLPKHLDELTPEDYTLLQMVYSEGLKISQCARMLGRPDQQVRRRHNKILQLLRQHFAEQNWDN